MYIICELCYSKNSQWAAGNHDKFMEHLLSSDHQNNAMSKFTFAWENSSFEELFTIQDEDRCIVVRGSYSLDEMEDQKCLVESFSEFGLLHDFVLLKRWPQFICAIIFDSKDDVRNVMQKFKTTKTGREVVFTPWRGDDWVRLRSEIQMPESESRPHKLFPSMSEDAYSTEPSLRPVQSNYRAVLDDSLSGFTRRSAGSMASELTFEQMLEAEKMPLQEIAKRQSVLEDLQIFLQKDFPHCTLNPFGSMITGIGTEKSPLDISFHPGGASFDKFITIGEIRSSLRAGNLGSRENLFVDIKQMVEKTVPVVTFCRGKIGIKCKIFLNHSVALSTSHLLQFYLDFDPRCRPFFLFIHHWAKVYNLFRKGQLSRYALNLMICVYLSDMKIIPSVFTLQQLSAHRQETKLHREKHVEWDISFCTDVMAIRSYMAASGYDYPSKRDLSADRILLLAQGFFKFYLNANLSREMICCYLAKLFPKTSFETEKEDFLPPVLFRYKQWAANVKNSIKRKSMLSAIRYLSIQDPFDHGANVSRGTNLLTVTFLEEACQMGLMGVKHFLSNAGTKKIDEIFSPILQARNQKEFSSENKIPKYMDQDVEVRLASELNGLLCVAYPFLNMMDPGKVVLFKPSKYFKQIFMQCFCGFTSQAILKKLLLYIWINFAQDFVLDYLTNCYFFRTQEKILPECSLSDISSFSDNIQNRKRKAHHKDKRFMPFRPDSEENGYSDSDTEGEADESSMCGDMDFDDKDVDYNEAELQLDLDELETAVNFNGKRMKTKMGDVLDAYDNWGETVIRRMYNCECTVPIWDNREQLRAQLSRTESQSGSSISHPLTLETMLSNLAKDANTKQQTNQGRQNMRLFLAYKAFVWKEHCFEVEGTSRVPLLLLLLRSDMDKFSQVNLNHLTRSIQKVFADYSKYRLKRWIRD